MFGSFDKAVYTFYPPSDIIHSYASLIKKRLSIIETNEESIRIFNPSLTALSSLHFLNERQEKTFINTLSTRSFPIEQTNCLIPIIKLLCLLFQIDYSSIDDENLNSFFNRLTQDQSLSKNYPL